MQEITRKKDLTSSENGLKQNKNELAANIT